MPELFKKPGNHFDSAEIGDPMNPYGEKDPLQAYQEEQLAEGIKFWSGKFGRGYAERNGLTKENIDRRAKLFVEILSKIPPQSVHTVFEVGANVGINLHALKRLLPADTAFFASEPNEDAAEVLNNSFYHPVSIFKDIKMASYKVDLIFTSGVMIHVPPNELLGFCQDIYERANKWIVAIEYFSREPEMIPYRGHDNKLWKRDFGSFWLDNFPLKPVSCGFAWEKLTGLNDLTYWIFGKE